MPDVEVPRPGLFGGFFGGKGGNKKKGGGKKGGGTEDGSLTSRSSSSMATDSGKDKVMAEPPAAIHAVVSLPPEDPTGAPPPNGTLVADLTIHKGELRIAPHMLHELFHAFFHPLDRSMDLIPTPPLTREMVAELREVAEGLLIKPWWGILNALPAACEGIKEAIPGLMPLNVNAKITEGIDLHLLAEPEAKGVKPTVPLGSVSLPPLSVTVMPNETDSVKQVRVRLNLDGDLVLASPVEIGKIRPLSGPGARPSMDPSQVMPMLLSEQMQLVEELSKVRAKNRELADELAANRLQAQAAQQPGGLPMPGALPAPSTRPAGVAPLDVTPTKAAGQGSARGRIGMLSGRGKSSARGKKGEKAGGEETQQIV